MDTSQQQKIKVALFDVCQTLVKVTTVTDFTERFLLSPSCNPKFRITKWFVHMLYKFSRDRLHCVDSIAYREHFIKLFKGYDSRTIAELAYSYSNHLQTVFKKKVFVKLNELKREGYQIYLVTGGLDVYLQPFAEFLGARLVCTVLEEDSEGRYTGYIKGIDCVGEGKVKKVKEAISFADVDRVASYAFGDSALDIPTLSLVGNVWVVDPDTTLEKYAREKGWMIVKE